MRVRTATVVLLLAACGGRELIPRPPDDRRPNVHRRVPVPPIDEMPGPAAVDGEAPEPTAEPATAGTSRPANPPATVFEYAPFPMRRADTPAEPVPYYPTAREEPFTWRISGPVVTQMDDPVGTFVAWFGIVRGVESDAAGGRTRIWVESKYFGGSTDASVLGMNFNGGGDFVATLSGARHAVIPLSLVHVYGTITSRDGGLPRVAAEYVREWDWGEFRFTSAAGAQRGSERWRKLCAVPIDDAHMADGDATTTYFIDRLGARSSFLAERPEFPKN